MQDEPIEGEVFIQVAEAHHEVFLHLPFDAGLAGEQLDVFVVVDVLGHRQRAVRRSLEIGFAVGLRPVAREGQLDFVRRFRFETETVGIGPFVEQQIPIGPRVGRRRGRRLPGVLETFPFGLVDEREEVQIGARGVVDFGIPLEDFVGCEAELAFVVFLVARADAHRKLQGIDREKLQLSGVVVVFAGRLREFAQTRQVVDAFRMGEAVLLRFGQVFTIDGTVGPLPAGAEREHPGRFAVEAHLHDVFVRAFGFAVLPIPAAQLVGERQPIGLVDIPGQLAAEVLLAVGIRHRDAADVFPHALETDITRDFNPRAVVFVVVVGVPEGERPVLAEIPTRRGIDHGEVDLAVGCGLRQIRRIGGVEPGAAFGQTDDGGVQRVGQKLIVLPHLGEGQVAVHPPGSSFAVTAGKNRAGFVVRCERGKTANRAVDGGGGRRLIGVRVRAVGDAEGVIPIHRQQIVFEHRVPNTGDDPVVFPAPVGGELEIAGGVTDRFRHFGDVAKTKTGTVGPMARPFFVAVFETPAGFTQAADIDLHAGTIPLQTDVDFLSHRQQRRHEVIEVGKIDRSASGPARGQVLLQSGLHRVGDLEHPRPRFRPQEGGVVAEVVRDQVVVELDLIPAVDAIPEGIPRVVAPAVFDTEIDPALTVAGGADQFQIGHPEPLFEIPVFLEFRRVVVEADIEPLHRHLLERKVEVALFTGHGRQGKHGEEQRDGEERPQASSTFVNVHGALLVAQVRARRMVAAVNRSVAVETGTIKIAIARPRAVGQGVAVIHRSRVARVEVALLADERNRSFLQLQVVRAVRSVAVEAAFPHRRVLPQEGATLFGVTAITLLVDRYRSDHRVGTGSMRIVTVVAADFAFTNRVVGRFPRFRPNVLVASETLFGGGHRLQLGIGRFRRMHGVAGGAGQAAGFMHAAFPEDLGPGFVAAAADLVLLGGRKFVDARPQGRIVGVVGVSRSGSVARFAAPIREAGEVLATVRGAFQGLFVFTMAGDTHVGTGISTHRCARFRVGRDLESDDQPEGKQRNPRPMAWPPSMDPVK